MTAALPLAEESNPGGSFVVGSALPSAELARFLRYRGDHVSRLRFAFSQGPSESVLDYGCGPGMAALLLPPSVRDYVGVELDPEPLAWAREHARDASRRTRFLTPSEFGEKPSSPPFDLILLLEVIEHVADPHRLLTALLGHLRPGGRLVISTPNGALSRHDPRLYQSPYHVTEFDPVEFQELSIESGRQSSFFEQHRVDRTDALPQLLARFLLSGNSTAPGTARSGRPAARKSGPLYRLWESLPQPEALWKIQPYPSPRRSDQGFSHQLAVLTG